METVEVKILEPKLPAELLATSDIEEMKKLEVVDEASVSVANQYILDLGKREKSVRAGMEFFLRPFKDALESREKPMKALLRAIDDAKSTLRLKQSKWLNEEKRRKDEEARKERERLAAEQREKARRALELAAKTNSESVMNIAVAQENRAKAVETAPIVTKQTVASEAGKVFTRTVWNWTVIDESKIPIEYFILDEKKLNAIARAYGSKKVDIPGVQFVDSVEAVNRG